MSTRKKRVGLDALASPKATETPAGDPGSGRANDLPEENGPTRRRKPNPNIKQIPAYLPLVAFRQLRALRFEESGDTERSYNSYILEGLDRVFIDRGLKTIADLQKGEDS
jgi:hypothetical protein